MSMLTPRGMGGQYRITGDKYPRMRPPRRRGRLVAAVVASVCALGLIGWGTLQLIDVFTGGGKKTSAAGSKTDCRAKAGTAATATPAAQVKTLPKPGQITVNVYNATARTGLAKATADELKKRGFRIGDVGNAPGEFDKKVKGTGILLGPADAQNTSVAVLGTQLADAERRTDAGRKGADLDLILGDAFKGLTKPADAQQALTALTDPQPTASPKKGC
ncbi:LytR C-terminal domain-containing protein [Streptomyces camelliae]|uniref:LytR C-terminal domain-containing protein n=1 Tax=Streptomyces camelliae TaxID=3004093 RepID=A0ABY7P6F2_9ACTN|nr:LytR C-terminal domain-containing protein [Streptomyces sp. HUAS 2-6]WBO65277.1 LytR C-terminal domain-containing protein [Streptomyces sp. HUAS 2-6]